MDIVDISQSEEVFTVSRLNREARFLLEGAFPLLWVEGEISNFAAPHSGHWYFSLKDSAAQVRCAMFRLANGKVGFTPRDGMHVLIKTRVSLYEGRGDYQLLVEHMEEIGIGKLRQAFEDLKKRLHILGLFNADVKKPLPAMPETVGIITSATGAAIRDILSVLKRRFPSLAIIIYPTPVQGEVAAPMIVNMIRVANRRNECDVLILARGGGSLEDLWPFNEEVVAHAIYESLIPIISGVGHEIDFTIADFVADHRAPTPSAAAELLTPHIDELLLRLERQKQRLVHHFQTKLRQTRQTLIWLDKHLQQQHPKRRLAEKTQHLDLCELALGRLIKRLLASRQNTLQSVQIKLHSVSPQHHIRELKNTLASQQQQIVNRIKSDIQSLQQAYSTAAGRLDVLSPLATLQRGYSITTRNKTVIRSSTEVKPGDNVNVHLIEGNLDCIVSETH
jgi:exodeoxyribonuclease VII large subunit